MPSGETLTLGPGSGVSQRRVTRTCQHSEGLICSAAGRWGRDQRRAEVIRGEAGQLGTRRPRAGSGEQQSYGRAVAWVSAVGTPATAGLSKPRPRLRRAESRGAQVRGRGLRALPGRGPLTRVLPPQNRPRGSSCGDAELPGIGHCVLHSHGRPSQGCRRAVACLPGAWGVASAPADCRLQAPNQAAQASVARVPRLRDALFVGKPGRAPGQGGRRPHGRPGHPAGPPVAPPCSLASAPARFPVAAAPAPRPCQRVPKHTWLSEYALHGDTRPTPG